MELGGNECPPTTGGNGPIANNILTGETWRRFRHWCPPNLTQPTHAVHGSPVFHSNISAQRVGAEYIYWILYSYSCWTSCLIQREQSEHRRVSPAVQCNSPEHTGLHPRATKSIQLDSNEIDTCVDPHRGRRVSRDNRIWTKFNNCTSAGSVQRAGPRCSRWILPSILPFTGAAVAMKSPTRDRRSQQAKSVTA